MLKHILLAPYYLTLLLRHLFYDIGLIKSRKADVPTICVGNVTVGGTGKTPHVEMILRLLEESPVWKNEPAAVLSRGYRRKTKGFRIVSKEGKAVNFGDEPMQIKKNFPQVTVAVDKNRIEGCRYLSHPDSVRRNGEIGHNETFPASSVIVLDDAFQYRKLKASLSIVLIDYYRPVTKDHLLPFGTLRDLPGRISRADILIVTKCPFALEDEEKSEYARKLGFASFNPSSCEAVRENGEKQKLFFTTISYCHCRPIFENADPHYIYSNKVILFTGIAKDSPLVGHLSDNYKIEHYVNFPDHHRYTRSDFSEIEHAAKKYPTALIATTEKDAQRVLDYEWLSKDMRTRLFMVPIKATFFSEDEKKNFCEILDSLKQ